MTKTKTCKTCAIEYEPSKLTRMLFCGPCYLAYRREKWISDKTRSMAWRGSKNARHVKNRKEGLVRFNAWKAEKGCCCCPENDPDCLDMHHMDPAEKDTNVSLLVGRRSWDNVMIEAAKCIVICSNCHRKLHARLRREEEERHHAGVAQG